MRLQDSRVRSVISRMASGIALVGWLSGMMVTAGENPRSEPWLLHATFEDFSTGTLLDSGANTFIARDGNVQMIHRWDLNNDGYLDLFVGQDHDVVENVDLFIHWGSHDGPQSLLPSVPKHQPLARLLREIRGRERGISRLPSEGGGRSLLVDLNDDGFLEIVVCNFIHNYSVHTSAFIYWGGSGGYQASRRTELPTLLAGGVAAADFNRDGFVDLAFSNQGNEEGGQRFKLAHHTESYIYWNGPRGFQVDNRTSLPTSSARDCAAGDVNGDGYPELIFVNNNMDQKSVYLYWGAKAGFSPQRRLEWKGGDPIALELTNATGDTHLDLVLMHRDDRAEVISGSETGLCYETRKEVPTQGAESCSVADLNKDGWPDLVFANKQAASENGTYIYWGSNEGFSQERRAALPALHPTAVAIADWNSDGWPDLALANERDDQTYDVNSYIYWNGPQGFHVANRRHLQGFGPVGVQGADLNQDGYQELVLINRLSGTYGPIDSFVYWGNPAHRYSEAAMSVVPATGDSAMPTIADYDQDGYVDVAFPSGRIYPGGKQGFQRDQHLDLGIEPGQGASTADLNRDGFLDLVISRRTALNDPSSSGQVLWGSRNGFDGQRSTELQLSTHYTQSPTIADFNKDGNLDLLFPDVDSPNTDIFWGNNQGIYSSDRHTHLMIHSSSAVEVADLNADGWLDAVFGGIYDDQDFGRPMRYALLVWGGPQGFSRERSLRLEAFESEEQAIADLNKDGYLDIVMTNYHAYTTRTLPAFIYWGSNDGSYNKSRRSHLPAESSGPLTVADFNQDGWQDIVVFNHIVRGDHGAGANIFWGSSKGYGYDRRTWLQTFGPHFGVRRDVGNIYHRRLEEEYRSAPLELPQGKRPARLSWQAQTPHGTAVRFQLRAAGDRDQLNVATWMGPQGEDSFFERPGAVAPADEARWLQYRALLVTPDGGSTPILEKVQIDVCALQDSK